MRCLTGKAADRSRRGTAIMLKDEMRENRRVFSLYRPGMASLSGQKDARRVQHRRRDNTGDNIIYHDAHTAMHVTIEPANRPGFPDIQHAEQNKTTHHPLPAVDRNRHQGNPHPDKLIPDNAAVVMHAHILGGAMAKVNAHTNAQQDHQRVEIMGEQGHEPPKRNGGQRPYRSGHKRAQAAAEAGRQQMPGIAQAQAAFRKGFI
ncbi:hypothetical protein PAJ_0300 [Pantoea ananatis AJ13355]|uniref:Uncharacterized protein n=1 Tax=Pantoea ananatis (strain AJ13355) TaxID=932677 RepID=A0A0H3L0W4_PANAA|nr:hypothetical protein PAJ_0300 [Pantoea ananatis AJ13355]